MINTQELITYSSDLPDWVCAKDYAVLLFYFMAETDMEFV